MSEDLNSGNELEQLHDAITRTIKAGMPDVLHVEAFPDLEARFRVPALFFGLTEFKPGQDTGTGKTAIHGKFQALVLVDSTHSHAPLQCMWIATRLATLLRGQYWDLDFTEDARDVHAEPTSHPQLESCMVWGVSWTQVFHVGEAEWPWADESQEVIWNVDVVAG
jgi:hypothetical protein